EHEQERGAVGWRRDGRLRPDRASRARAVLDDDRRLEIGLEQRLDAPGNLVGRPPGRKRHDEPDRIGRPALGYRRAALPECAVHPKNKDGKRARSAHLISLSLHHSAALAPSISAAPALMRGISSRPNSIASFNGSKPRIRNESTPSR